MEEQHKARNGGGAPSLQALQHLGVFTNTEVLRTPFVTVLIETHLPKCD
jgi:hypothetical protein